MRKGFCSPHKLPVLMDSESFGKHVTYNVHSWEVPSPQHVIAAPNHLVNPSHTGSTIYTWTLKTSLFIKIDAASSARNTSFVCNRYRRSCAGGSSLLRWTHNSTSKCSMLPSPSQSMTGKQNTISVYYCLPEASLQNPHIYSEPKSTPSLHWLFGFFDLIRIIHFCLLRWFHSQHLNSPQCIQVSSGTPFANNGDRDHLVIDLPAG